MAKALNFVITIGSLKINPKAVVSYSMKRNFSDVASPFDITLLDTPELWKDSVGKGIDLELYMAAGNRSIIFSYADTENPGKYQTFEGQIWDYTPTFVGDIKRLSISGFASRNSGSTLQGELVYNIDWNNYYNVRVDETLPWGALQSTKARLEVLEAWNQRVYDTDGDFSAFLNSALLDKKFVDSMRANSKMVRVTGRKGSINLPIPDTFTTMIPYTTKEDAKGKIKEIPVDILDEDKRFWGKLELEDYEESGMQIYRDGKNNIRAFSADGDQSFIQLNPKKKYFGAGQLVYNSMGVDISYIVKQLCILEGWSYNDEDIVQTELVPCSDKFKMKGVSASQFILDVLIPSAITPVGLYANSLDGTHSVRLDKGISGFTFYFDDNNKAHFKPLSSLASRGTIKDIVFGYNIKDTPVLSFQLQTKGTSFYTGTPTKMSTIELTTGEVVTSMEVASQSAVANIFKTKGHNESIDSFFGYTYEQVAKEFKEGSAVNGWVGLEGAKEIPVTFASTANPGTYVNDALVYSSSVVQKGLVTSITSSAIEGDTTSYLTDAKTKIKEFMTTASMNLWGVADLSPNLLINITIMVKSINQDVATVHPLSGEYLIRAQEDVFSGGEYIQKLALVRSSAVDIQYPHIDWSKRFKAVEELVESDKAFGGGGSSWGGGGIR